MNNAHIWKGIGKVVWVIVKISFVIFIEICRGNEKKPIPRYPAWYATELYEADEISARELNECIYGD